MSAAEPRRLGLFQGYGIELEYMVVDRATLDVRPIVDELFKSVAQRYVSDVDDGAIGWSNELVLHVVELKTNGPAPRLVGLAEEFARSLRRVEALLEPLGAMLLPGAMHPWMDPAHERVLWPHDNDVVYATFDRIFDCRGHGWSNLQSMHVNLPFGDDERPAGEFGRLHAAVRAVLPLLPALAAASPVVEGRVTGKLDTRLAVYRANAARVPSVTGRVVPERVWTRAEYEERVLGRIYADMAPLDPEGVVRHEWCNARGAIARFDRSAIEIRVLDVQECPRADLAIAAAASALVEALARERWAPLAALQALEVEPLAALLERAETDAERAPVADAGLLRVLGRSGPPRPAGDLWRDLLAELWPAGSEARRAFGPAIERILDEGPLARRILARTGPAPGRARLHEVWTELAACLRENRLLGA